MSETKPYFEVNDFILHECVVEICPTLVMKKMMTIQNEECIMILYI